MELDWPELSSFSQANRSPAHRAGLRRDARRQGPRRPARQCADRPYGPPGRCSPRAAGSPAWSPTVGHPRRSRSSSGRRWYWPRNGVSARFRAPSPALGHGQGGRTGRSAWRVRRYYHHSPAPGTTTSTWSPGWEMRRPVGRREAAARVYGWIFGGWATGGSNVGLGRAQFRPLAFRQDEPTRRWLTDLAVHHGPADWTMGTRSTRTVPRRGCRAGRWASTGWPHYQRGGAAGRRTRGGMVNPFNGEGPSRTPMESAELAADVAVQGAGPPRAGPRRRERARCCTTRPSCAAGTAGTTRLGRLVSWKLIGHPPVDEVRHPARACRTPMLMRFVPQVCWRTWDGSARRADAMTGSSTGHDGRRPRRYEASVGYPAAGCTGSG